MKVTEREVNHSPSENLLMKRSANAKMLISHIIKNSTLNYDSVKRFFMSKHYCLFFLKAFQHFRKDIHYKDKNTKSSERVSVCICMIHRAKGYNFLSLEKSAGFLFKGFDLAVDRHVIPTLWRKMIILTSHQSVILTRITV